MVALRQRMFSRLLLDSPLLVVAAVLVVTVSAQGAVVVLVAAVTRVPLPLLLRVLVLVLLGQSLVRVVTVLSLFVTLSV
jgi:hypothetical protein